MIALKYSPYMRFRVIGLQLNYFESYSMLIKVGISMKNLISIYSRLRLQRVVAERDGVALDVVEAFLAEGVSIGDNPIRF